MTESDAGAPYGVFGIDARPTDDEEYNWIHTNCETIATGILMYENPVGQKIVGIFRIYRDYLERNLDGAGEVGPQQFTSWVKHGMESRDKDPGEWEPDVLEALDQMMIEAVEERGMQPRQAFRLYDQWVEQTTEEFEEIHGMEGWFENAE